MNCPNCLRSISGHPSECPSCGASLGQGAAPPLVVQAAGAGVAPAVVASACSSCGKQLDPSEISWLDSGKSGAPPVALCANCVASAQQALDAESRDLNLGRAAIFGVVAAILSALAWYGIVVATDLKIGIVALLVGLAVGSAVSYGAGGKRGTPLQAMSLGLTIVAMFVAEYLILNHALRTVFVEEGFDGGEIEMLSVGDFASIYIEYLKERPINLLFLGLAMYYAWKTPGSRSMKVR